METISVRTRERSEMVNITAGVRAIVKKSGVADGICYLYVPHTTAGVVINEAADPSVVRDIGETLAALVPFGKGYAHTEGNADSHIKASLIGCSQAVLIENGSLVLGTWQGIFFCEFDGPRSRTVDRKSVV